MIDSGVCIKFTYPFPGSFPPAYYAFSDSYGLCFYPRRDSRQFRDSFVFSQRKCDEEQMNSNDNDDDRYGSGIGFDMGNGTGIGFDAGNGTGIKFDTGNGSVIGFDAGNGTGINENVHNTIDNHTVSRS